MICGLLLTLLASPAALAQPQVWSGLTTTFTKAPSTDDSLPENQDRITENVWLTRSTSGAGLYNAAVEDFYQNDLSPDRTQWATDLVTGNEGLEIVATNYDALTFTDWRNAYGGPGVLMESIVDRPAVLYLTEEDVYLDIMFTSWPGGFGSGGAFEYVRASGIPEPATASLAFAIGLGFLGVGRRRR
jgi:hypothetical protein